MPEKERIRGADIIAQTLTRLGVEKVFSLSGNHIMPVYDALIDTPVDIIHVRHEAACVHMADAYARTTGQVGIAMVTAGQGHTNGAAALVTALASEAPMVLLSGHAGLSELGKGAFQELRQAESAAPVTKASWMVQSAAVLGHDLAKAMQIARSGRPGPVHLSLPADLLEQSIDSSQELWPDVSASHAVRMPLAEHTAKQILAQIESAQRPLVLCGPTLCRTHGRVLMAQLQQAIQVPVIGMESPRGINDPSLGAFAEMLAQADLIVLLGKPLDFTLRFANAPFVHPDCRFIVIDPDQDLVARVVKYQKDRLVLSTLADPVSAIEALSKNERSDQKHAGAWLDQVNAAIVYRPPQWQSVRSADSGPVHPVEFCNAVQAFFVRHPQATLVCDGGEIGQWPQAVVTAAKKRLINGVAGAIGPSLPFALAAQVADPGSPVVAVMGDGTFGFHMAEIDTAVRYGLPVIVVIGNDARWNAEYQIQLRTYGKARAQGCELLPARYDKVVEALGGHGEYVTAAADLPAALERAFNSGKPACINVLIESVAAPTIKR
ncbi:thiamine pyrophosphate-binding protein [Paralcaligenes ureilyticus]|uniref:Acetolactate synthase-1/2/3 large subunit n=1 Tax=Paralcaligenes ureilyticus TaxID=627131 RepID=A0A4R3M9M3_9BURK|nr:thiamine pyrophosphate-binding protein [Paralcaligenes ureilyticus]TCT08989.1 acetolactate synthase-1/2/3 large subunit [Paralcaligenes ureilyticus]